MARVTKILKNQQIAIHLTSEEIAAKAKECATVTADLDLLDVEWSKKKKAYYDQRKPLAKRAIQLAKDHMTGRELRVIAEAQQIFDLETLKTWIDYQGHVYNDRDMSENEIETHSPGPLFANKPELLPDVEITPEHEPHDFLADDEHEDTLDVIHEEKIVRNKKDHTAA